MNSSTSPRYTCWLCSKDVSLESCKSDERGRMVHEFCHSLRLQLTSSAGFVLECRQRMLSEGRRRSWNEIAMDVLGERDRDRFRELVEELGEALAAREREAKYASLRARRQSNGFEKIVDLAVDLMRSEYASLQMLYPERGRGGELRLLSFRGFNPEAAKFWEWVRADSQSTCGIALRDTKRVVAPDIAACSFMAGSEDQEVYLQTGIHACQTTPLISRAGNVVGMISSHWRSPHQPSEQDFRQFDSLANRAAELIERSRREREP